MKIALTGASGFLGSQIASYLTKKGHQVIAHENITLINENTLIAKKIKGNLLDINVIEDLLDGVDAVVHTAAFIPKLMADLNEREKCFRVNTLLTQNLAFHSRKINLRKFVYLSSCNYYSDGTTPAETSESLDLNKANAIPYFLSKFSAEKSLEAIIDASALVILRIATPFGMGEPSNNVVPQFFANAIRKIPITIFGDGYQNINLVDSSSVASAVEKALSNNAQGTFNISSASISAIELANLCLHISGNHNQKIAYLPQLKPTSFRIVCNKSAIGVLDWKPEELKIALERRYDELRVIVR